MQAVEVTIQNLIGAGMDPKTENNPYLGFIYTSFQERATAVSHGATARHALELGDKTLGKICGAIASDEKRHERAYCAITSELLRRWVCSCIPMSRDIFVDVPGGFWPASRPTLWLHGIISTLQMKSLQIPFCL